MILSNWALALGGLGLLLLGMQLLTEGLKTAAGGHLQQLLEHATQTKARAALSGFTVTAVVQSSSAVVVALLGFTNAGLLKLRQAAWVVFGSNLGTTVTAWVVALVGLKLNIGSVAWPLVGVGMLMQLIRKGTLVANVGIALTGAGVLFVGLDTLREAFTQVAASLPIEQLHVVGLSGIVIAIIAGVLLTALVQSSSAALAIVLTASTTGVFSPLAGAAIVIGANIGTTATALLASVGATAHAKRLAAVHVAMNVVTGLLALILLAPLWWIAQLLSGGEQVGNISAGLAAFHTLFNLLGLALMWLLDERIFQLVERRYRLPPLRSGAPRYLDKTVMELPAMGLRAVQQEQARVLHQYQLRLRSLLQDPHFTEEQDEDIATGELLEHIAVYLQKLSAKQLHSDEALLFTELQNDQARLVDLRLLVEKLRAASPVNISKSLDPELHELLVDLLSSSLAKEREQQDWQALMKKVRAKQQKLKAAWLQQIAQNNLSPREGAVLIQLVSLWERSAALIAVLQSETAPTNNEQRIANTE